MDLKGASAVSTTRPFPRGKLGRLDESAAKRVVAAGGDVAMVIDRHGVICDMSLSNELMEQDGAASWLDQRWLDTVTVESRPKIDELLRDAVHGGGLRWREVNQITPKKDSLMMRYVAVDAGQDGRVIAIGRDGREASLMQQRLVEAQQAMERDYSKVRDAEFRYRLLFRMSGEAVLVVDAATKKIVEANPAAERFIGGAGPLIGEPFVKLFDLASQEDAASLLALVQSTARTTASEVRLSTAQCEFWVSASLFRQDRATQHLVRLSPVEGAFQIDATVGADLQALVEKIPDAFLVTDESLRILTTNSAFLDLVRIGSQEQAIGQLLSQFLGRPGLDRNILLDTLRTHGSVRNFSTVLRNQFDELDDVEVSAVVAPDNGETCFGFTIRMVGRRQQEQSKRPPELRRSVEQLTELVGRVTLKELVRETTDLVERLCIEAALELTQDNRASAAEVLGVSRQSLYSKLHRFGLGNLGAEEH